MLHSIARLDDWNYRLEANAGTGHVDARAGMTYRVQPYSTVYSTAAGRRRDHGAVVSSKEELKNGSFIYIYPFEQTVDMVSYTYCMLVTKHREENIDACISREWIV